MRHIQYNFYITDFNDKLKEQKLNNDPIYLVQQFFIHSNNERFNEIRYCLKQNIQLNLFEKIILLNEKIYSKEELDLSDEHMNKIIQIDIGRRLRYKDIFEHVNKLNLKGYISIANSDIFFDETIQNVRKSCLSKIKSLYCLLRYEYKIGKQISDCDFFRFCIKHPRYGDARYDAQDSWIYHTSQIDINEIFLEQMDILLGIAGCDNVVTMKLYNMNYLCINAPSNVRTYHNHNTEIRNYDKNDPISGPYLFLKPY